MVGEKGRAEESVVQGQLVKGFAKGSEYRAKQRNTVPNDEINPNKSNLSDRNLAPSDGKGVHFRLGRDVDSDTNNGNRRFVT